MNGVCGGAYVVMILEADSTVEPTPELKIRPRKYMITKSKAFEEEVFMVFTGGLALFYVFFFGSLKRGKGFTN